MAVWTDLPVHILDIIAQYLTIMEDFVSFSAISKECRFAIANLKKKPSLPPRYPWLMLAENKDVPVRGFVNLLTSKTIGVELPEATCTCCVGAHYGWLFVLGGDLQVNLLHPFTRQRICLPTMLTFPKQYPYDVEFRPQMVLDVFVTKIAMSASPLKGNNLNDDCVIVSIYGARGLLAFARLGDTVWTNIQVPCSNYEDVIYYKGKFYAVSILEVVVVCDLDVNSSPEATMVAPSPPSANGSIQKYLVESSGDLLLVCRKRKGIHFEDEDDKFEDSHISEWEDDGDNNVEDIQHNYENSVGDDIDKKKKAPYYTTGFSVYRLDESHDDCRDHVCKWMEVTTLGGRALFLGGNASASVPSSNGIKGNCIYFTDDNMGCYFNEPGGGGRDTGVYNMEDGTIRFAFAGKSRSMLSPPVWDALSCSGSERNKNLIVITVQHHIVTRRRKSRLEMTLENLSSEKSEMTLDTTNNTCPLCVVQELENGLQVKILRNAYIIRTLLPQLARKYCVSTGGMEGNLRWKTVCNCFKIEKYEM